MSSSRGVAKPRASPTIAGVEWHDLHVPASELRPNLTLQMGQCFNWNRLSRKGDGLWVGMVNGRALAIRQTDKTTLFAHLTPLSGDMTLPGLESELRDYFQLKHALSDCYSSWAASDERMKTVLGLLPGVRVVRQDPWECLISFICSSNNNIKRITMMLERLRRTYGEYQCSVVPAADGTGWTIVDQAPPAAEIAATSSPKPTAKSSSKSSSTSSSSSSSSKKRKPTPAAVDDDDEDEDNAAENDEDGEGEVEGNGSEEGFENKPLHLFSFPDADALAAASDADLRLLGVGYRSKFIRGSALKLQELGGMPWLLKLREGLPETPPELPPLPPQTAPDSDKKNKNKKKGSKTPEAPPLDSRRWVQAQLMVFPGIGRKVADCVALFSLDQAEAVPVDTHVWAIAVRDYNPSLKEHKSITPGVYDLIGDEFRTRFTLSGWAHSVLFAAELPEFRRLLPEALQQEMKAFAEERAADNKAKKSAASAQKLLKEQALEENSSTTAGAEEEEEGDVKKTKAKRAKVSKKAALPESLEFDA